MAADPNLVRAIRGPITLITLGVLFTLDHFTPYGFNQTWPVLLIVFGLLSLIRRGTQPPMPPPPPQGGPPPWATVPGAAGSNPSGGYRQSTYGNISPTGGSGQPGTPEGNPGGTQ